MAYTPLRPDPLSAACFTKTLIPYESTPKEPLAMPTSRKRKLHHFDSSATATPDDASAAADCPFFTPPASSTLNDSLINHLEKCNLVEVDREQRRPPATRRCIRNEEVRSAPTTPLKQTVLSHEGGGGGSGYRSLLPHITESPLAETLDILYPCLKPVNVTPRKFAGAVRRCRTPPKKALFAADRERARALRLLHKVVSIDEVMDVVFGYLSNGDLYRVCQASDGFERAVLANKSANRRLGAFVGHHKRNKENYQITPPSSPEKDDTPPVSPDSRHFYEFTKVAKDLESNQNLMKCVQCSHPAVVTDSVAQCTSSKCGYIYCKQCGSQSTTGPEDFVDKCGKAVLQYTTKRELTDLSNLCDISVSIFTSPINVSRSANSLANTSSGYYSCSESDSTRSTSTTTGAKRNLCASFGGSERTLATLNRMSPKRSSRTRRRSLFTPVCKVKSVSSTQIDRDPSVWDPPSPPRVQDYGVCSRRSKRNLKRLSR